MALNRCALDDSEKVSAQTAEGSRGSCPARPPENPVARLDAMGGRLQAMVHAAGELRPKLDALYASLNDEQKARFNAMGQQTAGLSENQNGRR
jgi:LTXXQ motif family protein